MNKRTYSLIKLTILLITLLNVTTASQRAFNPEESWRFIARTGEAERTFYTLKAQADPFIRGQTGYKRVRYIQTTPFAKVDWKVSDSDPTKVEAVAHYQPAEGRVKTHSFTANICARKRFVQDDQAKTMFVITSFFFEWGADITVKPDHTESRPYRCLSDPPIRTITCNDKEVTVTTTTPRYQRPLDESVLSDIDIQTVPLQCERIGFTHDDTSKTSIARYRLFAEYKGEVLLDKVENSPVPTPYQFCKIEDVSNVKIDGEIATLTVLESFQRPGESEPITLARSLTVQVETVAVYEHDDDLRLSLQTNHRVARIQPFEPLKPPVRWCIATENSKATHYEIDEAESQSAPQFRSLNEACSEHVVYRRADRSIFLPYDPSSDFNHVEVIHPTPR